MNRGYLLVFTTAIISGLSIFINKFGIGVFKNPYLFTFLKNVAVAVFLSALLTLFKDWKRLSKLTKKQWVLLISVGFVGGSIPFLLFFKGLSLTSSAEGSFIHKTMFLWASILAILFLKEKINLRFFIGALILFFANALLLKNFLLRPNYGNLLVFIATLLWAIENTISKYALKNLEGRQLAWARMFFGSIFVLTYLAFTNQLVPILSLNLKQINWVFVTSILLFGYVLTWYSGLRYMSLHQATTLLLFGSPITTFLSFISKTRVSTAEIFSGILIIFGIFTVIGLKKFLEIFSHLKKLIYVRP